MKARETAADNLRVDIRRLLARLDRLADIGARPDGGVSRLALTDQDKAGRDLVVAWIRELGLEISIDAIGNIVALRPGLEDGPPVMTGSHIDTVLAGGRYDGTLGVLGGLEVIETLNRAGVETRQPLAVAIFTNEEGVRFAPDMLGSLVYAGGLEIEHALAIEDANGARLGTELECIGYAGRTHPGAVRPHAFVELHIEQGPVLEADGVTIGAVEDLQGISWQEITIAGESNHAGTTPMALRHDAGYAAAAIAAFVRRLTRECGGNQVGTVGAIDLEPNLINVIAAGARLTVDLRNTDETSLRRAEGELDAFLDTLRRDEGVTIESRPLARFEPVTFDAGIVALIEETAGELGLSYRRMTSGAGHDSQMMARISPTAMIFVPSVGGISHNPAEHTEAADLEAGTNVLLQILLKLAS